MGGVRALSCPALIASFVLLTGLALSCAAPPPPADPGLPYLQEGEAAMAEGDSEKAMAAYQVALALVPGDPRALRGLLDAQVAYGEAEGALVTLAALEEASPDPVDPCPVLDLAVADRLEAGEPEAATQLAERARAEACPGSRAALGRALEARALDAAADGDLQASLADWQAAIAAEPGSADRYEAAAGLLLELGRTEEAVSLLADGLERHPESRSLRDLMVRALSIR